MRELTSAEAPPPGPDDHVRGPDGAPEVVFYGDFTCPECAVAAIELRALRARVHFRHFAMASRNRRAVPLALAAEAAGAQGMFWPFHDALYESPGRTDDPHLWELCRQMGLDLERFEHDRRSSEASARVQEQAAEAMRLGAMSTPTIVVGGRAYSEIPDLRRE